MTIDHDRQTNTGIRENTQLGVYSIVWPRHKIARTHHHYSWTNSLMGGRLLLKKYTNVNTRALALQFVVN